MASPRLGRTSSSVKSLCLILRLIDSTASGSKSFATTCFNFGISFAYRHDRNPLAANASRIVNDCVLT